MDVSLLHLMFVGKVRINLNSQCIKQELCFPFRNETLFERPAHESLFSKLLRRGKILFSFGS